MKQWKIFLTDINLINKVFLDVVFELLEEKSHSSFVLVKFKDIIYRFIDKCIVKHKPNNFLHPQVATFVRGLYEGNFSINSFDEVLFLASINSIYKNSLESLYEHLNEEFIQLMNEIRKHIDFIFIDLDSHEIQFAPIDSNLELLREYKQDIDKLSVKTHSFNKLKTNEKLINNEKDFLIRELKHMYYNAPKGNQMAMIHLFAIKNAEKLKNVSVKDVVMSATGKQSFMTEINKGTNLAEFVEIKQSSHKYFLNE